MSAEVEIGNFTLGELVDLALCSPIGAVNFNILRILLHEILKKLGIVAQPAALNDVEAHQINNFKSYIQGVGTASPMPGVLRYNNAPGSTDPLRTPRTGGRQEQPFAQGQQQPHPQSAPASSRSTPGKKPGQAQTQSVGVVYAKGSVFEHVTDSHGPSHPMSPITGTPGEPLDKKVERLERHLEALYALPTNSRLLGTGIHENEENDKNLSVNDMWQIIQLNNRVAAVEAAIQKMASLIEELASQTKQLKKNGRLSTGMQKEVDQIARTSSDLTMQMEPCIEKCERTFQSVVHMKEDLEKMKKHLTAELRRLSAAAGVDLGQTPSFMEPRTSATGQGQRLSTGSQGQRLSTGSQGQRLSTGSHGQEPEFQDPGFEKLAETKKASYVSARGGSTGYVIPTPVTYNYGLDGQPLLGPQQFDLIAIPTTVDETGRRISNVEWLDADGNPIDLEYDENGLPIVYGPDGRRISNPSDLQYDENGQALMYGPNGKRIFGSQRSQLGSDGQPVPMVYRPSVYDENGKLIQLGGYEFPGVEGDRSSRIGSTGTVEDERRKSDMMTGEEENGPHGQHPDAGDLTGAHPEVRHQGISHVPVDVVSGIPLDELQIDPFTDFQYPTILEDGTVVPGQMDPRYEEECKDQAVVVQRELQEQYANLQEMQRQMALDIQDKMETVYQKLLREIAAQHTTVSPYMAVGLNAEKCLGPGVCTGFGLPTGTAVCQFPQQPEKVEVCAKEGKVCPGRDVCPGKEVCPTCKDDILHNLRIPGDRPKFTVTEYAKAGLSSSKENLLRQMTSMTLLPRDLEELRQRLKDRGTMPDVFDEADVLEKLQTVWEAVNILKNNEENMAVRIVQQDTIIKKIPENALEKLGRISQASLDKLGIEGGGGHFGKGYKGIKDLSGEDVQLIFNNLSSLVLENGAMKEKLQKINESLLDFDQNVVTKSMLMNALSDKADKGQMNTKVSYDEFGAGMDELQTRLGNLLQEVYRKNELWKELTDQMREDLGEKLDKVEIAPLRAYFKNHLGKLEEKVNHLTQIMEEPDPAGTRKKLLKDYNCISCDRHTNISGLTNAPLLPVLGPILAGHSTASQRAFELYRMRPQTTRYDMEGRNFCQIERQGRGDGAGGGSMPLNQSDVLHLVNRYTGGSHTAISPQDRISALHKRVSVVPPQQPVAPEPPRPRNSAAPPGYYYDE